MQNWRSVQSEQTAERMIQMLAGVCNGAATWDGAGFSKLDTAFGHSLAERVAQGRAWTEKQAAGALKLIQKYSRQLGGKEVIRDWMQAPNFAIMPLSADAVIKKTDRTLTSADQQAVFRFKFNADLVAAIKQIRGSHKGITYRAQWDGAAKLWQVPVNETSIVQIMTLAREWEFEIEDRFEVYYSKVIEKLAPVREAAEESRVITTLGYKPGVQVDENSITITHTDVNVLSEFKAVLAQL